MSEPKAPDTPTSQPPASQSPERTSSSRTLVYPYRRYPQPGGLSTPGPYISTRLFTETHATPFRLALVDCGADISTFPFRVARWLCVDPKAGDPTELHGIGPKAYPAWIHDDIGFALKGATGEEKIDIAFKGKVVFCEELSLTGLLGRDSFWRTFRIDVDEIARQVSLAPRPAAEILPVATVPDYLRIHVAR